MTMFWDVRDFAKYIYDLANSEKMINRRKMWYAHNELKWNGPPPILLSAEQSLFLNIGINDDLYAGLKRIMNKYNELQEGTIHGIVFTLSKRLWYYGLDDDHVIEPWLDDIAQYNEHGMNMWGIEQLAIKHGDSTMFIPTIIYPENIENLRIANPTVDAGATLRTKDRINEVLDGVLDIRTEWRHNELTIANFGSMATQLLGQKRFYEWCIDYPNAIRLFIGTVAAAYMRHNEDLAKWRRLEDNHCFIPDNFPWSGPMVRKPSLSQMWIHADSQDFEGISPEMTEDYFFTFLRPVFDKFGMASFGCCESLNKKLGYVKTLPHLRRVTISEKTDWDYAIDTLGKDIVYSVRPCLVDTVYCDDEYKIRAGLRKMAKRFNGLHWEINFPGITSFNGDKHRFHKWVKIAREVTQE